MTRQEEQIKYIDKQFKNSVNCDIIFEEVPFYTLHEYLLSHGWVDDDNCDWTNGWEIDFWWYMFNPKGIRYYLNGSMVTSSNIKIYKADD